MAYLNLLDNVKKTKQHKLSGMNHNNLKRRTLQLFMSLIVITILVRYADTFIQIYVANSMAKLFDLAVKGRTTQLLSDTGLFVLLFTTISLVQGCFTYFTAAITENRKVRLKQLIFVSLFHNKLEIIERYKTSDVLSRLKNDIAAVANKFSTGYVSLSISLLSAGTYFCYLSYFNLLLTSLIFSLSCLGVVAPVIINRYFEKQYRNMREMEAKMTGIIKEGIDNFLAVKLYNLYEKCNKEFRKIVVDYNKFGIKTEKLFNVNMGLNDGINYIIRFGTYGIVGYFLLLRRIDTSDVVRILFLSSSITASLRAFFEQFKTLRESKVSFERVQALLPDSSIESENEITINDIDTISLSDITFAYEQGKPILENLHLDIIKGDKIVIKGPNGSGKSTLIMFITGMYGNTSGSIEVNGMSLKDLDIAEYRKHIAWISQRHFSFPGSGMENITLVNIEEHSQINDLLNQFQLPYELMESGEFDKYSEGQKQKVILIRELVKRSSLIILDEPDSYIDRECKEVLKQMIRESNKTILLITHNSEFEELFSKKYELTNGRLYEEYQFQNADN